MAKERLRGSESSFRPYIECLPWDALHPLMWTDDEVDLLEGTYAQDEILELREQVGADMAGNWADSRSKGFMAVLLSLSLVGL